MTVGGPTYQTITRRSTRVRARIPIRITSLKRAIPFSLLCETMTVNAHGCGATIPQQLEVGMPVDLRVREGGQAKARIVVCQPVAGSDANWMAGIELDMPGNIWGLTPCPEDWVARGAVESMSREPARGRATIELKMPVWPLASPSAKAALPARASEEEFKKQLAGQQERIARLEDRLAAAMASVPELVRQQLADFRPLQEQACAELKGIIAEARSQDEQETAQREALQASAEALQQELAQARASLESSMGSLPERIQAPIAAAVEDALAQAHAAMSAALARDLEALQERGRIAAAELRAAEEALRNEREATQAQITEAGAQREELQRWLEELGPMLDRAADLRQEALSLLGALQRESQRCETQVRALLTEKDGVETWVTERAADFRKMFHDALVETTGQIKGRLQMAVEMIEQPAAKLRDQAAQQLQEQAARQARHLREQTDEACDRITRLQRDTENWLREALRAQMAETSATFERQIAQLAQRSVEEWRAALARNLDSITTQLAQKLPDREG